MASENQSVNVSGRVVSPSSDILRIAADGDFRELLHVCRIQHGERVCGLNRDQQRFAVWRRRNAIRRRADSYVFNERKVLRIVDADRIVFTLLDEKPLWRGVKSNMSRRAADCCLAQELARFAVETRKQIAVPIDNEKAVRLGIEGDPERRSGIRKLRDRLLTPGIYHADRAMLRMGHKQTSAVRRGDKRGWTGWTSECCRSAGAGINFSDRAGILTCCVNPLCTEPGADAVNATTRAKFRKKIIFSRRAF